MTDRRLSVAEDHTLPLAVADAPDASVDGFARAKPSADRNRAFELAELERRLFGTDTVEPFRVGRFTVMEKLGSGGMGVVYAAFDPQLERKIAVKFLRSDLEHADERGAARLVREAQALARLDHPNVVSVFDVGTYEGGVYIAMEFVSGSPLSAWVRKKQPHWQEILQAYVQAGWGLAAAHQAGIVHRDFKPDNALRGNDGRVRVLDFGLAAPDDDELARALDASRSDAESGPRSRDTGTFSDPLTRTGAVMGTPLYMAPEQHLGRRADARSDQFAFCISLWIALFDERPFPGENMAVLGQSVTQGLLRPMPRSPRLPKRVRQAIIRGLQVDPADRFERIEDLLIELDVDRRRRRGFLAASLGLGLAAAVGGGIAWQLRGDAEPSLCEQSSSRLDLAWNEARAMDATARYAGGDAARTWNDLRSQLERQVSEWRAAHASVCGSNKVDLRQLNCLEWRLEEIETFTQVLASESADRLHLVAAGVSAMTPPGACSNSRALDTMVAPSRDPKRRAVIQNLRTEIVRANILHKSGSHSEALRAAESVVRSAQALNEAAVEAESLLLLGEVLAQGGRGDEAQARLREALRRAEAAGHDQVRARALAVLVGVVGFGQGRPTAELEDRFEAVRQRLGDLPSRAVADYLLAITMVRIGHGAIETALEAGQGALDEVHRLEIDDVQAEAQIGLALTLLGRYDDAGAHLDLALEKVDSAHPHAVLVLGICGIHRGFAGEDTASVEFFERALALEARREQSQPHYRALVGTYMANSVDRLGRVATAITMQKASIAQLKRLWGPQHGALGRAYLQFGTTLADAGRFEEADEAFRASLAIWRLTHGEMHRATAHPETGIARVYLHDGRNEEALELLEGALPKLALSEGHPAEDARTHFHLARALARTGGDQKRAHRLAQEALSLLAGLGPGYDRDRRAIHQWSQAQAKVATPGH